MFYYLDIETARDDNTPQALLVSLKSKVKPDGRLKDEFKILDSIEERWAEQQESFGLSPMTGKIICWSVAVRDSAIRTEYIDPIKPYAEKELLEKLVWCLREFGQLDCIVTFNGKSFDIPFILIRCAINRVSLNWNFLSSKYDQHKHFDVRLALTNFDDKASGTLLDWCNLFNIPKLPDVSGSDIQSLYDKGDFDTIGRKNAEDVECTRKLFHSIIMSFDPLEYRIMQSQELLQTEENDIMRNTTPTEKLFSDSGDQTNKPISVDPTPEQILGLE